MQGDIFQLDLLATQVAVPKPQPTVARSKPTINSSTPEVAIYNEDDLSHLLYVNNHPHHHHHHHDHEQKPFTHPADAGMVVVNVVELSDCESWSGSDSESSGEAEADSPATPALSLSSDFADPDLASLDAYRRKGRRNAFSVASFEDGFEFPVFLGRQAEEWPRMPRSLTTTLRPLPSPAPSTSVFSLTEKKETDTAISTPSSSHGQGAYAVATSTDGPVMSWWPESLEAMEDDWTAEELEWVLETEKEKLAAREEKHEDKTKYASEHVANISGSLMSWWPTPMNEMECEWSERFYE
jgi:hypothetical protein